MNAAPPRPVRRTTRTPHGRQRTSHWRLWAVLSVVLILGGGCFIVFSSTLKVTTVTVNDGGDEGFDAVRAFIAERVLGINLMFVDTDELTAAIGEALPELEPLSVSRAWPREVQATVRARIPVGTWCRATEPSRPCVFFDRSGALWGEALPSSGTLIMTVIDERPEGYLQTDLLDDLLLFAGALQELDVPVRQVVIRGGPLRVVSFVSADGYEIRFSRMADLHEQIDVLATFLPERRATGTVPAEYMDLTVPGKVYFK